MPHKVDNLFEAFFLIEVPSSQVTLACFKLTLLSQLPSPPPYTGLVKQGPLAFFITHSVGSGARTGQEASLFSDPVPM